MKNKRILIIGAMGYIGSNISDYFKNKKYCVYGTYHLKKLASCCDANNMYHADVTNLSDILHVITEIKPDIVIHAVALSGLELCQRDVDLAMKINVCGTDNIIDSILKVNPYMRLVFLSSDYVFSGDEGNYKEDDLVNPNTIYGKSKAIAEEHIRCKLPNYIILRTSGVFGRGGNFFNFVIHNLEREIPIEVYTNTLFTPTYIDYLIDSIEQLIMTNYRGIIHVAGDEKVSRYNFATRIANVLNKDPQLIKPICKQDGLIAQDSSLNTIYPNQHKLGLCSTIEKSLYYNFGYLIRPYFHFSDIRGRILGISRDYVWQELNYVESKKNTVRGKHYHKSAREGFYIIVGKINVKIYDLTDRLLRQFVVGSGDFFIVEPNLIHEFEMIEDAKWINMLSNPMDAVNMDIYH